MTTHVSLSAARRLTLHFDAMSHWRLAWDEPDWLGIDIAGNQALF